MLRLQLRESSGSGQYRLPNDIAIALSQLEIATIAPLGGDNWTISNVRKVGIVRVGDYQVTIQPKVPVSRLFFMLGYSLDRDFWRSESIEISRAPDLLNTIADTFLRHVTRATQRGVIQGYEPYEDSSPVVRGRLDIPAQLGRRAGLVFPAHLAYDEFTVDVAENRLLLTAAHRLLRLPSLSSRSRADLRKLTQKLDGVNLLTHGQELPRIHFTRLTARYKTAVALARIILENSSVEQATGSVTATAFLLDMWKVFEDFVTIGLAVELERRAGTAKTQAGGVYLDAGSNIALRPDLLWSDGGRPISVVDTKYKATKLANYPNPDVYQMLAYCVRFGITSGHLIYAKGEVEPQAHEILGHEAAIYCHAVDLSLDPGALLERISTLAESIARLRTISSD